MVCVCYLIELNLCLTHKYMFVFDTNIYLCIHLNPKKTGGPKRPPPPRHFARLLWNAQSSRRDTLWLYSFKFPAHFDTKFVTPGGTVLKLRNFLYMHIGPKMAPKCDFVYKINANLVFSHSSYKYAYFYSQWLKLICFSIIVLQKLSATNFTKTKTKTKGKKNKEIHKKFIKQ